MGLNEGESQIVRFFNFFPLEATRARSDLSAQVGEEASGHVPWM